VGANLLILPAAYRYLSASQVALWFNYIALYSLLLLLDFGITSTTARAFSQAWGSKVTDSITGQLRADYERFASIYRASQAIYSKVALAGLALALVLATPYLLLIGEQASDYRDVWYSWPIYCVGLYLSLRQLYLVPALRGMDKIEYVYKANIARKAVQVISTLILLVAGIGIVAVSIGFLMSCLISRFLLGKIFQFELSKYKIDSFLNEQNSNDDTIRASLAPKVVRQGVISLANFFQDKAALFYVSAFCGLDASAKYGLTLQIMGLAAALSNVYYNSVQAKMIEQHVQGNVGAVRAYLRNAAVVQVGMIAGAGMALFMFGEWGLHVLGMSKGIVDHQGLGLIVTYFVLFNLQLICASYLLIRDDYSMLWPYVLSGLTFVLVVASAASVSTLTYSDVVSIQLGVLLAYNAWKWPVKARQALQLSVSER
jgi:O-antigen/teichoic acid export membrane protein